MYFHSHAPNEPPHVHVDRDDQSAKFWLDLVALARNLGFGPVELVGEMAWTFPILIPENAYETYTSLRTHWRWTSQTGAQSSFP
jgi:hypothetical protein